MQSASPASSPLSLVPHTQRSYSSPETIGLSADSENETFSNPILKAPAQDPHVTWIDGRYYYCESSSDGIFLRVADDFLQLGKAMRIRVWAPPAHGPCARNIWAPELHVIEGRCYIYFAADDGKNANHRMWVLASQTADVMSDYSLVGPLETEGWAIDGTVLTDTSGRRFFVWSGWPGKTDGQQNLYIAPMLSPTQIGGPRVLLTSPEHSWERLGMPICEGPQVLQRDGKTFIVYSASASWTANYSLGMLVHEGGDFLDPKTWRKVGQVFQRNEHAWGMGHCGFLTSAEGEDWIFYHAKTRHRPGWEDREVRAQPFTWSAEGWPIFGEPVPRHQPITKRAAKEIPEPIRAEA